MEEDTHSPKRPRNGIGAIFDKRKCRSRRVATGRSHKDDGQILDVVLRGWRSYGCLRNLGTE